MMKITSMFDFYQKAKIDGRYQLLAVWCYKKWMMGDEVYTFEKASRWMNEWIEREYLKDHYTDCQPMVDYLNLNMPTILKDYPHPILPFVEK